MKSKAMLAAAVLPLLWLAGCQSADVDKEAKLRSREGKEFTAGLEGTIPTDEETKTFVDGDLYMYWTADDRLTIFTSTYNDQYRFEGQTGDNNGAFSKISSGQFVSGNPISTNYGVYPYNATTSMDKDEKIILVLPETQNYAQNSFGLGANTMVAVTGGKDDYFLPFKNVCGYLVVRLYGEGAVKRIKIEGNNGEKISGAATVTASHTTDPVLAMAGTATESITLDCGEGVTIGATAETATEFWIVIPPVTFTQGFTVTIEDDNNGRMVKKTTASRTVQRNILTRMAPLQMDVMPLPEAVDLGLSVKWASCNLGAATPEGYGDYYAWGETSTKSNYKWSTYKYCNGSETTMTKYCTNSSYGYNGFTDNKTVLDLSDDAARVKLGGSWRMPTDAEWTELREQCTWTWTTQNGVNGYQVTSKTNGNSIFLPAAGYRTDARLGNVGSYGYYFSSSLNTFNPMFAWRVYFSSSYIGRTYDYRCYGRSIRPVYGDCIPVESVSLSNGSLSLAEEDTYPLVATIQPANAWNPSVNWTSNNTSVATVTSTGLVTAVSPGTATIMLTTHDGGYTATCTVTVNEIVAPDMIDLGLSVKWGSFNLGAVSPEGYGCYYACGETEPKSNYDWSTYKYCNGSYNTLTKYCNNSSYGYNGFTDNKTVLDLSDDAARVKLGGSWRMPTDEEWTELREQCTWTWTTQNGVNGYRVTSKTNGNSIFLPAAGYRYDTYLYSVGPRGFYWSSTLRTGNPYDACYVYFYSSNIYRGTDYRYYGLSIRPVYGDCIPVESVSLSNSSLSLAEEDTYPLVATIQPANAWNPSVNWTSNNTSVATVTSTGVVMAVSPGTATITVTTHDGGYTATCTVTVNEIVAPDMIDLGLSVKWGSFNLGSNSPEGYGSYYAWGETETKSSYDWSTYKYCNGDYNTFTKYCNNSSYGYSGFTDNKTVLDLLDDVARVKLGGSWRMPTDEEWTELREQCTWTWTTQNGVNGYQVTSKTNGNSIFLPAAGCRRGAGLYDVGSLGHYWSSALDADYPYNAWFVGFNSSDVGRLYYLRFYGQSIRPVLEK